MSFLNELHPELFYTRPRRGGAVTARSRVKPVCSSKNVQTRLTVEKTTTTEPENPAVCVDDLFKKTCREYRINKVMNTSQWSPRDDDEREDSTEPPDPLHDAMMLVAATISSTMMIAAGATNIPKSHLVWTMSYLDCIRDDYGESPPNARGMMNNIKLIDSSVVSFFHQDEVEELPDDGPEKEGDQPAPDEPPPDGPPPEEPPPEEAAA